MGKGQPSKGPENREKIGRVEKYVVGKHNGAFRIKEMYPSRSGFEEERKWDMTKYNSTTDAEAVIPEFIKVLNESLPQARAPVLSTIVPSMSSTSLKAFNQVKKKLDLVNMWYKDWATPPLVQKKLTTLAR